MKLTPVESNRKTSIGEFLTAGLVMAGRTSRILVTKPGVGGFVNDPAHFQKFNPQEAVEK
jgi:sulfopyruvate decarboxylase TPP-binding subunit